MAGKEKQAEAGTSSATSPSLGKEYHTGPGGEELGNKEVSPNTRTNRKKPRERSGGAARNRGGVKRQGRVKKPGRNAASLAWAWSGRRGPAQSLSTTACKGCSPRKNRARPSRPSSSSSMSSSLRSVSTVQQRGCGVVACTYRSTASAKLNLSGA